MRYVGLFLISLVGCSPALAQTSSSVQMSSTPQLLTDAVYTRPLYGGPYRHCGGSCLKNTDLSWFCPAHQQCSLNCAIAPPAMKCAAP